MRLGLHIPVVDITNEQKIDLVNSQTHYNYAELRPCLVLIDKKLHSNNYLCSVASNKQASNLIGQKIKFFQKF